MGKTIEVALTLGAFVGGFEQIGRLKAEGSLSVAYIWVTYFITAAFGVGAALFLPYHFRRREVHESEIRRTREEHEAELAKAQEEHKAEVAKFREVEELGSQIVHLMAEEVRLAARDKGGYDWHSRSLTRVLGELLPRYMSLLVSDGSGFCVTVKCCSKENRVDAVFRCGVQGETRCRRDTVAPERSIPMRRFNEAAETQQWVHIPSLATEPGLPSEYLDDLTKLGIQSILAFPLRGPQQKAEGGQLSRRLGFISLDSQKPQVFSTLFDGAGAKALRPLDVFFATADALATIVMLKRGRNARGSSSAAA